MSHALLEYVRHFRITGWGWYWIAWAALGFGVPEGYGLAVNTQDTLSWQWWGIEHIDFTHPFDFAEWTPVHWATGLVLLTFVIWLGGHLVFGIWR